MAGIGRLVPGKDSSSATDPSGGGDDDYYEDYESSDGQVTATLDVANYVDSGETLKSVEVGYGGSADCDSQADFCTADASTQVSFNTGESESGAAATDSDTANDSYSGTLTTTNENVETIDRLLDGSETGNNKNPPDGRLLRIAFFRYAFTAYSGTSVKRWNCVTYSRKSLVDRDNLGPPHRRT